MFPRNRQVGKHEVNWSVNIEKWWRRAAGYSRLNATSSPPSARRNSGSQMKKIDSERFSIGKDLPASKSNRRPSTARPVVIVERSREIKPPSWNNNAPRVNLNEEFIEVFYWTQSRYNYPGQLERYKKNLCYCCADCPACQADVSRRSSSDKHRPLAQARNLRDPSDSLGTGNYCYNGNILRTSYA